jgi:hypothetical protein
MTGFFVENVEYKGIISGNGSITKTGFGNTAKWKFSGNHTGSGAMTISVGMLELNANWNGNLTLGNGRTLKVIGNHTVAGVFTNNRNNSNMEFDLVAGPSSLTVTGGMAYGGTSNGNITVKANNAGTYNLITAPGIDASQFTLVNTGTWTGGQLQVSGNILQLTPPATGVTAVNVTPGTVSVEKGATQQFNATVTVVGGANQSVNWTIIGANNAGTTINSSGLLSTAFTETATTIKVRATSVFDNTKFGEATVTVSESTGIETLQMSEITIWVENYELRIMNYENTGNNNVAIYNVSGQLVHNSKLINNSINISHLPNGVYIVKIGNYTGKFIIHNS